MLFVLFKHPFGYKALIVFAGIRNIALEELLQYLMTEIANKLARTNPLFAGKHRDLHLQ